MRGADYLCIIALSLPGRSPSPPLPAIFRSSLVIVEGRAPIWRYGMALHPASTPRPPLPSPIVDPRLRAVAVATHSQKWQVGQVVDVTLPSESDKLRE